VEVEVNCGCGDTVIVINDPQTENTTIMKIEKALWALCALSSLIVSAETPPASGNKAETIPLLEAGALAPDFVSKDLAGKEVRISDWHGKIVVLDFWATWCGPCKASLPHTAEVAKRYKDQGVVVLANCTSDTCANFNEFVQANGGKIRRHQVCLRSA
jgi:thiol-disulfide isomerase/thioredoxin